MSKKIIAIAEIILIINLIPRLIATNNPIAINAIIIMLIKLLSNGLKNEEIYEKISITAVLKDVNASASVFVRILIEVSVKSMLFTPFYVNFLWIYLC